MVYIFDGFNWTIRLNKGERLSETLEEFFSQGDIHGGWVTGIGAALEAELGYYNLETKQYHWQTFKQTLEVVSLQGSIALGEDGKPMYHLHGVFSDEKYQTIGGHVKDLVVGGTLELFVHRSYKPLHRKRDDETGLNLLDL